MDIEQKVIEHDERIKALEKNLDKMDNLVNDINKMALSIERLTINQSTMLQQQSDLKKDVEAIKTQEGKDAHDMKQKIIVFILTSIIGALLAALIALILK